MRAHNNFALKIAQTGLAKRGWVFVGEMRLQTGCLRAKQCCNIVKKEI